MFYSGAQDALREWNEENAGSPPAALAALERRYQGFMAEKFDPMLGRTHRDDLAHLTRGTPSVVMTDAERGAQPVCGRLGGEYQYGYRERALSHR